MKYKKYILLCIIIVLLFSCNKKKETEQSVIETEESKNIVSNKSFSLDDEMRKIISSKITATDEEKETMKEFLYKNDEYYEYMNKEKGIEAKIIFIEKANFGMPDKNNWIVLLSNKRLFIYAISDIKLEKYIDFPGEELGKESDFNIMQDIPGTHIGGTISSFGDFNGDSIDEMFRYEFYERKSVIKFWGYNKVDDRFFDCEIPFEIIDKVKGPAPVEFIIYQRMYGFKVYNKKYHMETDTTEEGKWYFYTWDAEQKNYIEIGEIIE